MRLLAAFVTAAALLGSVGIAAAACAGHASKSQETAQDKVILPPGTNS